MFAEYLTEVKSLFKKYKPKIIGEIGTHNGKSMLQMLSYLLHELHLSVEYTGYDMWGGTKKFHEQENNGKAIPDYYVALNRLENLQNTLGKKDRLKYELIKGNTHDTLTKPRKFDFVFVDGGHSYKTVKHDYDMVKESKIVLIDDSDLEDIKRLIDEIEKDKEPNMIIKTWVPSGGKGVTRNRIHTQTVVIRGE